MNKPCDNRILLIDDMPSIHEDFRKILVPRATSAALAEAENALFGRSSESPAIYELDCASSGEHGLELLRTARLSGQDYSLAFVDMRMPAGWDGVRTIEALWREDANLQVVICTAYSDHPLEESLARLGSPDRLLVLKKPFDPIEVSQLARALTAKRRNALDAQLHLRHLQQVLAEMDGIATQLRRRNEELEHLATEVSRQLRSPMMLISRFTAMLSEDAGTRGGDKIAAFMDRLRAGARSSERLVEGVLALTEVTRHEMHAESLDFSEIATQAVECLRKREPHRNVSVGIQDGMRAWGDRKLVTDLVERLLDNAWKFTSEHELAIISVCCAVSEDGERIYFVRDSGRGFAFAARPGLFGNLQEEDALASAGGPGLGFAIVGRIVQRHAGRIWAESKPNEGTTVFFTLPNPSPTMMGRGWTS
jgi:signal transduction histidine kinase